jgi:AraC-like DNA-binding protein
MRETPDLLSSRPSRRGNRASEVHEMAMDVLTDVLDSLGLQGRLFCRSVLSAPWCLALPAGDQAHFHVIERGRAWLHLDGDEAPVALLSGDLIVLPHARGHRLSDSPGRPPVPIERLLHGTVPGRCRLLRHGGGGAETAMICGSFTFRQRQGHPLLSLLPPVIHVSAKAGRVPEWLDATLKVLAAESRSTSPGRETIVARLIDILFVQVLRTWLAEQPPGGSWLRALKDPHIAAALAAIHEQPGHSWTVGELARHARQSRSPFAARFTALVGEPPLTYLTRWRMQVAAGLLRREPLSIGEVAARVGYESEPAFSKAFKRATGIAPGTFRRQKSAA